MASEIKMPQLGMNQDSAVIVTWLKVAGDKVALGDALLEVETDKATVEVEALAEGYLSGIQAVEGDDVPVGNLIAMIVDTDADVTTAQVASPSAASEVAPSVDASDRVEASQAERPQPEPFAEPPKRQSVPPPQPAPAPIVVSQAKVLASPKAKLLARERGIDLAALRVKGLSEPIHVKDLPLSQVGDHYALSAQVSQEAVDALLSRSEIMDRTMLFASFAAGAWRRFFEVEDVAVTLIGLDGEATICTNPDRGGEGTLNATSLSLIDLCETRLSSYTTSTVGVTLCVAKEQNAFLLTLSVSGAGLSMPQAVGLLNEIAARVEDPIRQLL
jgi:pyruvate/2-oxoglutarate dehydrogenase complex dihydrolipoamide acyltransferase (E2) component